MRDHISCRRFFGVARLATKLNGLLSSGQIGPWHVGHWIDFKHTAIRIKFITATDGGRAALLRRMTVMLLRMSGSAERCARLLPRNDHARGNGFGQAISGVVSGGVRNGLPQKRGNLRPN